MYKQTDGKLKSRSRRGKCKHMFYLFQERNLQICREWISNFPFQMLARCSLAVQTSQVGSKIPQQVTAIRINRQKVTECNPPSGNSEAQKQILATSNFDICGKKECIFLYFSIVVFSIFYVLLAPNGALIMIVCHYLSAPTLSDFEHYCQCIYIYI